MADLVLYGYIDEYTAKEVVKGFDELKTKEAVMRTVCWGGSTAYGWTIISKMTDWIDSGKSVILKIDGIAASMACMLPLFATKTIAVDAAQFMLHRAEMYISNTQDQEWLDNINKKLRAKMEAKLSEAVLKKLKGVGFDDLFDPTKRIEIQLKADEALAIGLIDEVKQINPTQKADAAAAMGKYLDAVAYGIPKEDNPPIKNTKMTDAEIAALKDAVAKESAEKERSRVNAWMEFITTDAVAVKAGIASGKEISMQEAIAFMRKEKNAEATTTTTTVEDKKEATAQLEKTEATAVKTVTTDTAKTEQEIVKTKDAEASKEVTDFLAEASKLY